MDPLREEINVILGSADRIDKISKNRKDQRELAVVTKTLRAIASSLTVIVRTHDKLGKRKA